MAGYIGTQPVPQATQTRDSFTCTSGQTVFATGGYTPQFLDVYLNGIFLNNGTDYTASNGSDVILTVGASADDTLEVVAYTTFEVANVTGADDFTVTGSFTSQGIDDNAASTAITIDSSQNVGIRNTNPSARFEIDNSATTSVGTTAGDNIEHMRIWGNNGNSASTGFSTFRTANGSDWNSTGFRIQHKTDVTYQSYIQINGSGNSQGLSFGTGSGGTPLSTPERMRIDGDGNVGIGTDSPSSSGYSNLETAKNIRINTGAVAANPFLYFNHNNFSSDTNNSIGMDRSAESMVFNTSGNEAMRIDASGRVTMPYQPLFSASDTRALDITNAVLTSANCFNSIDYNVGNHFNSSNGRFTAPVSGYYDCSFHAADVSSTGKLVNVRIRKNGVSNTGPLAEAYNQSTIGSTNVYVRCIVQLSVGDYIDFQAARLNSAGGVQHKRFIVHMIG